MAALIWRRVVKRPRVIGGRSERFGLDHRESGVGGRDAGLVLGGASLICGGCQPRTALLRCRRCALSGAPLATSPTTAGSYEFTVKAHNTGRALLMGGGHERAGVAERQTSANRHGADALDRHDGGQHLRKPRQERQRRDSQRLASGRPQSAAPLGANNDRPLLLPLIGAARCSLLWRRRRPQRFPLRTAEPWARER